jgi:hypothetical protein
MQQKSILILAACFMLFQTLGQMADMRQTRQEIKQKVENRQWDEITSIMVNNHPNFFALSMRETEWLHLFRKDYGSFFAAIDYNEPSMSLIDKNREVYLGSEPTAYRLTEPAPPDELKTLFINLFNSDWQVLLYDVERATLSEDLIQFLRYYIRFTVYQLDICSNEKQRSSLDEALLLMDEFNYSKYAKFAEKYSSGFQVPSNWGYGVSIGLGYNLMNGTISNTLRSHIYFLSALDVTYKRILFRTELGFGYSRVRSPYFYNTLHDLGRQIGVTNLTSTLGYNLLIGDRLVISPMVGMDLSMIRGVVVEDVDPETLNFRPAFSTGLAYGVSVEYNFRQPECIAYDEFGRKVTRTRHSTPFLRLSVSRREYPMLSKVPELNGSALFFSLTAGGFAQSVRKVDVRR